MDSGIIIGALALFTIGITLAMAVFHFGYFLKDPANLEAAETVAADRESATTRVTSNTGAAGKSLSQRLNEAQALENTISLWPKPQPISPQNWE